MLEHSANYEHFVIVSPVWKRYNTRWKMSKSRAHGWVNTRDLTAQWLLTVQTENWECDQSYKFLHFYLKRRDFCIKGEKLVISQFIHSTVIMTTIAIQKRLNTSSCNVPFWHTKFTDNSQYDMSSLLPPQRCQKFLFSWQFF